MRPRSTQQPTRLRRRECLAKTRRTVGYWDMGLEAATAHIGLEPRHQEDHLLGALAKGLAAATPEEIALFDRKAREDLRLECDAASQSIVGISNKRREGCRQLSNACYRLRLSTSPVWDEGVSGAISARTAKAPRRTTSKVSRARLDRLDTLDI
jgi:hypothetical protein